MFCSNCGTPAKDGEHFCQNCGASLQEPGGVMQQPSMRRERNPMPPATAGSFRNGGRSKDPYQPQIAQIKLQLKQLKLDLKQITTRMSSTRAQYNETSAFVPRGLLHRGYKWFEDARLLGPQQQKQQIQNQIMQLEQELINLQQQQAYWKSQQ